MFVSCDCEDCKNYDDGYCGLNTVYISNAEMTAAGFLPLCTDYEEDPDYRGECDYESIYSDK